MKMHFVFSALIASQLVIFDHQLDHLTNSPEVICDQCLVVSDFSDIVDQKAYTNINTNESRYVLDLIQSKFQDSPAYYSSRAPPFLS